MELEDNGEKNKAGERRRCKRFASKTCPRRISEIVRQLDNNSNTTIHNTGGTSDPALCQGALHYLNIDYFPGTSCHLMFLALPGVSVL